jgi:hypothetical protein
MLGQNRVAIMQPYFLPYIGYWQLMSYVDIFVVYDDIEYTKKGWINRNRYLLNGRPETFTLPLKKDSDYLDVRERRLSESFAHEKEKLARRLESAYRKAPFFREGKEFLDEVLSDTDVNLFQFIFQSIKIGHDRLGMKTRLVVSSSLAVPRQLSGPDRVIATCQALGATDYINPIGGIELYDKADFSSAGIKLHFQKVRPIIYSQFSHPFIPNLSVVDLLMFCGSNRVRELLLEMDLC